MNRILGIALIFLIGIYPKAHADETFDWSGFKSRFISRDGRVVDYQQGQISHSEGQGFAMLLAVLHNDRDTLGLLWKWTQENIQVRSSDNLLAWKWGERLPGKWGPVDLNNATDGDILVAMALLQGAQRWRNDEYRLAGLAIVKDLKENLVIERNGRLILLPGYYGFIREEALVINPSYLIFPAYKVFAKYDATHFWEKLWKDSLKTLQQFTFTRFKLPADWILWSSAGPAVFADKSELFSFDAIRVPLYLAWDRQLDALPNITEFLAFVDRLGYLPCCVNLVEQTVSLQDAPAGYYAVLGRVAAELGQQQKSQSLWQKARDKLSAERYNYYSHVLFLLAQAEMRP